MTVEEKVGQLFVVAFVGQDASPDSDIGQLITQYKIGGVVLLSSNSNFYNNTEDTPKQVAELTNALQKLALASTGPQIPLFVAIDHEGDGPTLTRLRTGFTPLPSAMAIGATWDPVNAAAVGEIAGRELAAVGVNMLLGPVVDVLNNPRLSSRGDIGIRAFGGDPYWVGQMGRAYIRGVHRGSQDRVLTVAKHFPGHGGSDRLPDDEVATVDKSFQELQRIELPPFFHVTQLDDTDPAATTDALMTSHIRYRGFQGDIRQFTPPISFDPAGMNQLLTLPEFANWRVNGLVVSDSLGVPAVRRYFDPQMQTFPAKQVAKEAFLAGNDVLVLSQFARRDVWSDQVVNIKATIDFFASEYRSNPGFRQRVDEALIRILRAKEKLYDSFSPTTVNVPTEQLDQALLTEDTQAAIARIAQQSITLIYPRAEVRRERLPAGPRREETIVIVSEDTDFAPCAEDIPECAHKPLLDPSTVADVMLRIYGPQGAGQITRGQIHSLTFSQLRTYLTAPFSRANGTPTPAPEAAPTATPTPAPEYVPEPEADVGALLSQADWIVFAMLDMNTQRFEAADAVQVFLDLGPRSYEKRIVALALNSPYRLDTTEISKLTAYYAAYSKIPAFIEAAIRALFGDLTAPGAPPVNVEGIGYDLSEQLAPDPDRKIPVVVLDPQDPAQVTEFPTAVRVQTGRVLDHNGNIVPDGTQVTFWFERGDGEVLAQATGSTTQGIAEAQYEVPSGGPLYLRATSMQASSGRPYRVNFQPPTPTPTVTLSPTATPTAEPIATPILVPTRTQGPLDTVGPLTNPPDASTQTSKASPGGVGLSLTLIAVVTAGGAITVVSRAGGRTPEERVRLALTAVVAGLAGYSAYSSGWLRPVVTIQGSPWLAALIALICAGLPIAWAVTRPRRTPRDR